MIKKLISSRAVVVSFIAFVTQIVLVGSDGAVSEQDLSKLFDTVTLLGGLLIGGWKLEDAAHKVALPPPVQKEQVR